MIVRQIVPAAVLLLLAATPSSAMNILSTTGDATIGTFGFRDGDVVSLNGLTAKLFLTENRFSGDEDIDALHHRSNGNLILSTTTPATIGGLSFQDGDLVEYNATTDSAVLLFSESLFTATEDIDAVHLLDNGNLLLSTDSDATLGGLTFRDGDIVEYDLVGNTATLFFSEDNFVGSEDIDALLLQPDGTIVLSTQTPASLGGLSFDEGDLIEYDPLTDTATVLVSHTIFAGAADIDAVSAPEPAGWLLISQVLVACGFFAWRRFRAQLCLQPCRV